MVDGWSLERLEDREVVWLLKVSVKGKDNTKT